MSTTTPGRRAIAGSFTKTGAMVSFLRKATGSPSTNMTSVSLIFSSSTLDLWDRPSGPPICFNDSTRGFASRSLSIVLVGKPVGQYLRESLKAYLRQQNSNSPVDRMSEVAAKIFEESLNKVVLVQLKGGRSVRGRLYSFDQHMNLVLEEAEDVTNSDSTKKLGTIIVRGDNVVLVSPPPKR